MGLIILIIVSIIFIFISIKLLLDKKYILDKFNKGNTIVFGPKGKGKDLLFQRIIIWKSKKKNIKQKKIQYLSNIDYGYNGKIEKIKSLSVNPNTFNNMINENIIPLQKQHNFEGLDYYLSDGGIYLPCQYDNELNKTYPSFPIYYATSRHLYDSNIHINTQALNRVWLKIREQADSYFYCLGAKKIFNLMICKIRYYENYESASRKLNPLNSRLINKFSKAETDLYKAQNGIIKNCWYILPIRKIKYDTRIFETKFFNNVLHKVIIKRNRTIYEREEL